MPISEQDHLACQRAPRCGTPAGTKAKIGKAFAKDEDGHTEVRAFGEQELSWCAQRVFKLNAGPRLNST